MKRIICSVLAMVAASLGVMTATVPPQYAPEQAQWDLIGQLYYDINGMTKEATVLPSQKKNTLTRKTIPYAMESIVIPDTLLIEVACTGEGCKTPTKIDTIHITTIAAKAFVSAAASSVVFSDKSYISAIGTLALSEMANMTGKLTLPASLEHLDVSSILLPGITEIEFLGEVPPSCDIAGGYNPWTSATEVTSADINVIVPDGALSAYQDAEGIGDYFTCLKKEDPTSLQDNEIRSVSGSRKIWRGNQLLIEREGVLYNMVGARVQ